MPSTRYTHTHPRTHMPSARYAQLMYTNASNIPTAVCFHHNKQKNKHFIHYGAVKGSKRVRRELDMPCSLQVYDSTLHHIALQRYSEAPIVTEIIPMVDTEIVSNTNENDIYNSLARPHQDAKVFWEHMIQSCGVQENVPNILHSIPNFLDNAHHKIKTDDVLQEKHYEVQHNEDNTHTHIFRISYRFYFTEYSDVIVYTRDSIMSTHSILSLTETDTMWKNMKKKVLQRPEFLWNVPKDVYLNEYDKV